ncbi:MAG: L-serine ammonia-lyase [Betaproteobacteria bacterium]|nr:L-serine ammonia-lyase [Betaproteobacteria bacterium]
MAVSVFDLFKIGIGPSSSHTVGPMRAARRFALELQQSGLLPAVVSLTVTLYGSLAHTGHGHGTDRAILLGLCGEQPDSVDIAAIEPLLQRIYTSASLPVLGQYPVPFEVSKHLLFLKGTSLPQHPNGMRFCARDAGGGVSLESIYFSTGGGFIATEAELALPPAPAQPPRHDYRSAEQLLALCRAHNKSIGEIAFENELALRDAETINRNLDAIWQAMHACIERGLQQDGALPGGLALRRRAKKLHQLLLSRDDTRTPLWELDWVNLYAMAVNEENASGGRVVTAPTNGAAGIVPAVMMYYQRFCAGANTQGLRNFLLTAAALCSLYKENSSISGAEVGCQGEVGVASSIAAAGLTAALGGSIEQVENAAEIGMEHNLGLTCDPVGGLVQIPCIERNAMGAVKAINAAHMALSGDGQHKISLDKVIETMRQTGIDMQSKYKETSLGGLAVNVIEC